MMVDDGLICTAMLMSAIETAASYKCANPLPFTCKKNLPADKRRNSHQDKLYRHPGRQHPPTRPYRRSHLDIRGPNPLQPHLSSCQMLGAHFPVPTLWPKGRGEDVRHYPHYHQPTADGGHLFRNHISMHSHRLQLGPVDSRRPMC